MKGLQLKAPGTGTQRYDCSHRHQLGAFLYACIGGAVAVRARVCTEDVRMH